MRRVLLIGSLAAAILASTQAAVAQPALSLDRPDSHRGTPKDLPWPVAQGLADVGIAGPGALSTGRASAQRALTTETLPVPTQACPDWPDYLCGSIDVPVDRTQPSGATLPVGFMFRPHDDQSVPSAGTTLVFSQPGLAATSEYRPYLYGALLHGDLLASRDVLLVEPRGSGASFVDCPQLQSGGGSWDSAITECVDILGSNIDYYRYGDMADDQEAVRVALGVGVVDVFGIAFGLGAAEAYVARYPQNVRSLSLDSPRLDTEWFNAEISANALRIAGLQCRRSAACSGAYSGDANGALEDIKWLIRRLRSAPISGSAADGDGVERAVYVDETALAWWIDWAPGFPAIASGELPAAARAVRAGDTAPLLRLAAETGVPSGPTDVSTAFGVGEPPPINSEGAFDAAYCQEIPTLYDRSATIPERLAQAAAAVRDEPQRRFAPFDRTAVTLVTPDPECVRWPAPVRDNPILASGQQFPRVPAVILTGDLNGGEPVENSQRVKARHPGAVNVDDPQCLARSHRDQRLRTSDSAVLPRGPRDRFAQLRPRRAIGLPGGRLLRPPCPRP